jgi:hypothetical protein
MCAPKVPRPDPAIGDAAKQQAQIAQAMSEIAKDQLAWEKDRAKVQDPLIEKIVNQQISSGDANARRSEEQWKIYRDLFAPVEERMVRDASDSILGEIENRYPIRLSNGEAVLNKKAVELVGEDFVHRINAGELAKTKETGVKMKSKEAKNA